MLNNPVMFVDPTGEFVGTVTGGLIGGVVGGVSAVFRGDDVLTGVLSGAVSGAIVGAAADIIVATGGTGLVAIGGMAVAGAIGGAAGSVVCQVGNQWQWGTGSMTLGQSVGNINTQQIVGDALVGAVSGAVAGVMGQVLTAGHHTSVTLHRANATSQLLSQEFNVVVFNATGDAVTRSATNAFLVDTVTGAIYSISLEVANELMSSGGRP